jgi:DNA polymerase (family X)
MVSNAEVAERLSEIADLLDLLGERFKPEAYRRAARSLEALPESLETIAARGELESIPGVGEAISGKVAELLRTGSLPYLERLRAEVPAGVLELMRLPGVGPKTARRFWTELALDGPVALARAIDAGRLEGVHGFGEKKIGQLREAVRAAAASPAAGRMPIEEAWPLARALVEALRRAPSVHEVAVGGSFRRGRETVGDLDILVTADRPEEVFDTFSRLPEVGELRLRGPTKETVVLTRGLQVDLRVVEPEAFGAALQYFTGSKDHNVKLRSLARDHGLKVNEYGVYRGDERVAGRTEQEVYGALGLAWIPPELREDRGEIGQAASGDLPRLVEAGDLVRELHVHLEESDDHDALGRLARSAGRLRLRSVGVVVATWKDGAGRPTVPAGVLGALREPGAVRFVGALEVEGDPAQVPTATLARLGAEYLIVARPAGPATNAVGRVPSVPVRLVAHVEGTPEAARPALDLARGWGAAVEVGPGGDRLDSTRARVAREAGIPLAVPTGVDRPPEDPTCVVALGFARRAGARREDVLNAREEAPPGPPEPAGRRATGRRPSTGRPRP